MMTIYDLRFGIYEKDELTKKISSFQLIKNRLFTKMTIDVHKLYIFNPTMDMIDTLCEYTASHLKNMNKKICL